MAIILSLFRCLTVTLLLSVFGNYVQAGCPDTPCLNGGTCNTTSSTCACPAGYGGSICDTDTTCTPNCKNQGKCVCAGSAGCTCPSSWTNDCTSPANFIYPGNPNAAVTTSWNPTALSKQLVIDTDQLPLGYSTQPLDLESCCPPGSFIQDGRCYFTIDLPSSIGLLENVANTGNARESCTKRGAMLATFEIGDSMAKMAAFVNWLATDANIQVEVGTIESVSTCMLLGIHVQTDTKWYWDSYPPVPVNLSLWLGNPALAAANAFANGYLPAIAYRPCVVPHKTTPMLHVLTSAQSASSICMITNPCKMACKSTRPSAQSSQGGMRIFDRCYSSGSDQAAGDRIAQTTKCLDVGGFPSTLQYPFEGWYLISSVYLFNAAPSARYSFWVGYSHINSDYKWKTLNSPLAYPMHTNWDVLSGAPANPGVNLCTVATVAGWQDRSCSSSAMFACQTGLVDPATISPSPTPTPCPGNGCCPCGWLRYNQTGGVDTCYKIVNTGVTLQQAIQACDTEGLGNPQGAYLATSDTAAKISFLTGQASFLNTTFYWVSYARNSYGVWKWPNNNVLDPAAANLANTFPAVTAGGYYGAKLAKSTGKLNPVNDANTTTVTVGANTFTVYLAVSVLPYICEMQMASSSCEVCQTPPSNLPLARSAPLRVAPDKCLWFLSDTGDKDSNDAYCATAGMVPISLLQAYENMLVQKTLPTLPNGNSSEIWIDLVMSTPQTDYKWEGEPSNYTALNCTQNNQWHYPCVYWSRTTYSLTCDNCAAQRFISCTIPSAGNCTDLCPYGSVAIGSSCYKAYISACVSPFAGARANFCYATTIGTWNLASITSASVKSGLERYFSSTNLAIGTRFWIGFDNSVRTAHTANAFSNFTYSEDPDSVWEADNGDSSYDPSVWAPGEPKVTNHYALATWNGSNLVLTTVNSTSGLTANALCERPKPCYRCDNGWVFFNGHCYYKASVSATTAYFRQLRGYCDLTKAGSYLLTINSAMELKFIMNLVGTVTATAYVAPLGLYRKQSFNYPPSTASDFYEWDDGEEMSDTWQMWAAGEPSHSAQTIGALFPTGDYGDISYARANFSFVICEAPGYITTLQSPNKTAGTPSQCAGQLISTAYLNSSALTASSSDASYPVTGLLSGGFWLPTDTSSPWFQADFGSDAKLLRSITTSGTSAGMVYGYRVSYTKTPASQTFAYLMPHRMVAFFAKVAPLTLAGNRQALMKNSQNICQRVLAYKLKIEVVSYEASPLLQAQIRGCSPSTPVSTYCDCWIELLDGYSGATYPFWVNSATADTSIDPTSRNAAAALPLFVDNSTLVDTETWPLGWMPLTVDSANWWQANFAALRVVSGLVMAGSNGGTEYITSYYVQWSHTGYIYTLNYYKNPNGTPKLFAGPSNASTAVQQTFCPPMKTKVLRILPVTYSTKPALVISIFGCMARRTRCFECCDDSGDCSCKCPLGYTGSACINLATNDNFFIDGKAPVCEIEEMLGIMFPRGQASYTASSNASTAMNATGTTPAGFWSPSPSDTAPYLQITLGYEMSVSGIRIAGYNGSWITEYTVTFQVNVGSSSFHYPILQNRSDSQSAIQVFQGARDDDPSNFVLNRFCPTIRTNVLRIRIVNSVNPPPKVRVLLNGCMLFSACQTCCTNEDGCVNRAPLGYSPTNCAVWNMGPIDCEEIAMRNPNATSGIYTLYPPHRQPFQTYCEMDLAGGGWTVILSRVDSSQTFDLGWNDYRNGFGNLSGNFWLGNANIYSLTGSSYYTYTVLVYLVASNGLPAIAVHDLFSIQSEAQNFTLTIGTFLVGDAGNSLSNHTGMSFWTKDVDSTNNCSNLYSGGWWFNPTSGCMQSKLTGVYGNNATGRGILWKTYKGLNESLPFAKLMLRRMNIRYPMTAKQYNFQYPFDCQDVYYNNPAAPTGVYNLYLPGFPDPVTPAYCEMVAFGGGWTAIVRRSRGDTTTNFSRSWAEYENGFGSPALSYYLGNAKIYMLTLMTQRGTQITTMYELSTGRNYSVRITNWALSNSPYIYSTCCGISYTDNAGDSFTSMAGQPFRTPDRSDDNWCAKNRPGGWWYKNVTTGGNATDCANINFNGILGSLEWERGVYWGARHLSLAWGVIQISRAQGTKKPFDCDDIGGSTSGVYWIFPFETMATQVYCDQTTTVATYTRWTIIQRREFGNVDFYQNWDAYKNGFPISVSRLNASTDYWLGNEKVRQLTQWTSYMLLIQVQHPNGTWYNSLYDDFGLRSESDWYSLFIGNYQNASSNGGDSLSWANGTSFVTYDNGPYKAWHVAKGFRSGWWRDDCCSLKSDLNNAWNTTLPNQVMAWPTLVPNGVSVRATRIGIRRKGSVTILNPPHASNRPIGPFNSPYRIAHQSCGIKNPYIGGDRLAMESSILAKWMWKPIACQHFLANDCSTIQSSIAYASERFQSKEQNDLYVNSTISNRQIASYCDMETFGGGWTVIQRRLDNNETFHLKTLADYDSSFGNPTGNFWLGISTIRELTASSDYELLVEMRKNTSYAFAYYTNFYLYTTSNNLLISGYRNCSTAGDSLSYVNGTQFIVDSCGTGGWWQNGDCPGNTTQSNLNAPYGPQSPTYKNMFWKTFTNDSTAELTWTEMKVRRRATHGRFIIAENFNCTVGNSAVITSIFSADDCKSTCTCYQSFTCVTAVYDRVSITCTLRNAVCGFGQGLAASNVDSYFRMDDCDQFAPSCGPPPTMNNTVVEVVTLSASEIQVNYTCIMGTISRAFLAQSTVLTCTSAGSGDRHWQGQWLDCRHLCGLLPDVTPANASFTDGYVDTWIGNYSFACNNDSVHLAGNYTLICAPPYGKFLGEPLNCTSAPCAMPPVIANSTNNYTNPDTIPSYWVKKYQAVWNYTCSPGFIFEDTLETSAVIVCDAEGHWSQITTCIPDCRDIGSCQNNGSCVAPNTCSCNVGWLGTICDIPDCSPLGECKNNGTCILPNTCLCSDGWFGTDCTTANCTSIGGCLNGATCSRPNVCTCAANWLGTTCSIPDCAAIGGCQNGGTCVAPNTCNCTIDWTGSTCSTPDCSLIGNCYNGGSCVSPSICQCADGWYGSNCRSPNCTSIGECLNGGTCSLPNTCTCTIDCAGVNCAVLTAPVMFNVTHDSPLVIPIPDVTNLTDATLLVNVQTITDLVAETALSIISTISSSLGSSSSSFSSDFSSIFGSVSTSDSGSSSSPSSGSSASASTSNTGSMSGSSSQATVNTTAIVSTAVTFMSAASKILDRIAKINIPIPVEVITNITSAASDVVMNDVTSSIRSDTAIREDSNAKCKMAKDDPDNILTEVKPEIRPSGEQMQQLCGSFSEILDSLVAIVKGALRVGQDFTYSGSFFAGVVKNVRFEQLPGLRLETKLASVEFPQITDAFGLVLHKPDSLTRDSPVSVMMIGYLANVLDVNLPFNMPTISIYVYVNKTKELTLNPSTPVLITARPVVTKASQFNTEKVAAQCDVSKIKCDLTTNADQLGSLASFPISIGAGDFVLIFPPSDTEYTGYVSLNVQPTPSSYDWKIVVGDHGSQLRNGNETGLASPRINFANRTAEFRMIIPESVFSSNIIQPSGKELTLYVNMKRNFTQYGPNDELPASACQMQHCFGYHLRIGPATSSKNETIRARKKRSSDNGTIAAETDGDGIELEPTSTESAVSFKSSYFGDFGADLVIMPNTIEFTEIFANFASLLADNYAVLAFVVVIVDFFIVAIVFTVYLDKKDLKEWAFLPITSNTPDHSFRYLISVSYYNVRQFHLVPLVYIRLLGNIHDTNWRLLEDGQRKNFDGKRPANFMLSTFVSVGELEGIELAVGSRRREEAGQKPFEVHMDKVTAIDMANGHKYVFLVKSKMTAGQTTLVELAKEEDIKGFRYLVASHSRVGINELHPWVSIAQRPLPSNWTRSERLGCVISALFLAMLVNAMFYGKEASAPRIGVNVGGFFRVSWFTVWTSIVGSIIVVPPTTAMGFIFKKVRRRSAETSEWETIFKVKKEITSDDDDEDGGESKKPFQLPWGCVFVAWFLVAACVGVSGFIVFMYSLQWGREKSLQWLSGMLLHIVQDIIIIQTVKTLIISVFSSTLLSLPEDGLNVGKSVYSESGPKRKDKLFRQLRNVIGGIFHHALYVFAFALVIGTTQNRYAFRQVNDLKTLLQPNSVSDVISGHGLIFEWLDKTILPNFLNGNQLAYGGVFKRKNIYSVLNHDVVLLGPFRLRQQRVTKAFCPMLNDEGVTCQKQYVTVMGIGDSSEQRIFNSSWKESDTILVSTWMNMANLTTDQAPWSYREGDGPPYAGLEANYRTGGYFVDLPPRLTTARAILSDLKQRRWLDNATSVLFVDFVVYNAQINLFVAVKVVFEALSAGAMKYHMRLYPLNLYQYSGASSFLTFTVQGIWIVILLTHLVKIIWQIAKQGLKQFGSSGWNWLNLAEILFSLGIVGLFAVRIKVIIDTVTRFQTDRTSFVNLDLLANWEELMFNLYGVAFFMAMLLFFRHLTANKYWAIFIGTLSKGKSDLFSFGTIFFIITFIFAMLGYAWLSATCGEFRSFTASVMTLIQNIIGVVGPLMNLGLTSRLILVYCMAYSTVVMFLAVQVFMTIISFTYSLVESDVEGSTDWDVDLADYIADEWAKLLGTSSTVGENNAQPVKSTTIDDALVRLENIVKKRVEDFDDDQARHERYVKAWQNEIAKMTPAPATETKIKDAIFGPKYSWIGNVPSARTVGEVINREKADHLQSNNMTMFYESLNPGSVYDMAEHNAF